MLPLAQRTLSTRLTLPRGSVTFSAHQLALFKINVDVLFFPLIDNRLLMLTFHIIMMFTIWMSNGNNFKCRMSGAIIHFNKRFCQMHGLRRMPSKTVDMHQRKI